MMMAAIPNTSRRALLSAARKFCHSICCAIEWVILFIQPGKRIGGNGTNALGNALVGLKG